jgi:response regulator RpfG family c-di-GMP phosphodiesterase
VRGHHERWDGAGKPDALAGEKIPLGARIIAVAETFEALTAGRGCPRLEALSALDRITRAAGSEFDPAAVDALGQSIRDGSLELFIPELALPATAQGVAENVLAPQPSLLRDIS